MAPNSVQEFTDHLVRYTRAANLAYAWGPPRPYHAESARFAQHMLEGDFGAAWTSWKRSWGLAVHDPVWVEQAVVSTVTAGAALAGGGGPAAAPRPPAAPALTVIEGGGAAAPLTAAAPTVVATEAAAAPLAVEGNLALAASEAPVVAAAPAPAPALRLLPGGAQAPAIAPTPTSLLGPTAALAGAVGVAAAPGQAPAPAPATEPAPDEEEDRKRRRCEERYPSAIPIHWPSPLWAFEEGIGDPGSYDLTYDLPEEALLIKMGSTFYNANRPEIQRYRNRIENPPFNLTVPTGWPIHHKWPLYLGGPGDDMQAEGSYTAEGEIIAPPNLVVMSPAVHQIWHRLLSGQPAGPMVGMGPSERTPDGTDFCVLELIEQS